jgi:hypothetical protein
MGSVATLFRVQTGKAWVSSGGKPQWLANGSMLLPYARPITLGFGMVNGDPVEGASDLVGWSDVLVTQAMVGHTLAVLTTFECKESGGGKKRAAQKHFADVVKEAGGISGIVNSPEAAERAHQDFYQQFQSKRN